MRERAVLAAIVLVFLVHALHLACVAEDAYIAFRYAANLANGLGLVWNPGDAPVEGYTPFLWVVLCALALRLGIDAPVAAQVLGALAGAATLALVHDLCRRVLEWRPLPALVPPALLALSGPLATWSTSGLATSAFALCATLACHRYVRYWRIGAVQDLHVCFASLLLAMLTRPEGVLIFAVIAGRGLAQALRRADDSLRQLLPPLAACAGLFALYFVWRWSYFGQLLPNTYYAKTGGGGAQALRGAFYSGYFAYHFLLPLLPLALVALGFRRRESLAVEGEAFSLCALLAAAWTLYVVLVGGDYMAMYRFFAPVLPFLYVLIGFAANRLLDAPPGAPGRALAGLLVPLAAAGTLLQSTPLEARLFSKPPLQHGTWRGVQTERWHVARLERIARFFARYKRSSDESIATRAIGVIGYRSGLRVLGFHGLVDPHIAHMEVEPGAAARSLPGHERDPTAYLFSLRPTYFMFERELTPEPLPFPSFGPEIDPEVRLAYERKAVRLRDEVNGEAGWFSFLQRRDARADAPPAGARTTK